MVEPVPLDFIVAEEDAGLRLDQYLVSRGLPHTRSQIKRMIDQGACVINGAPAQPAKRLRAGDSVVFTPLPPEPVKALPEEIPLSVLYEDHVLIVVDKPAGMVVHPAAGHSHGTLVNALLGYCQLTDTGDPFRPGIVHRLDKLTSGVMVASKQPLAHAGLAEQFSCHSVERRYWAVVAGRPVPGRGVFDTLHGRRPNDRKRFSSRVKQGRRAITHYRVLQDLQGASLVEAKLETGRTHQVRVHFADHGHPVLGDPTYGRPPTDPAARAASSVIGRQALHARVLAFDHPGTGERLRFVSPPPADMQQLIAQLEPSS